MSNLLYRQHIVDHYQNPRHFGRMPKPTWSAEASNPLCGDKLTLYVSADDEGKIYDISFAGEGCAISMASASMLLEKVSETGMGMRDLLAVSPSYIYELLGVPISAAREKCALLILSTIKTQDTVLR